MKTKEKPVLYTPTALIDSPPGYKLQALTEFLKENTEKEPLEKNPDPSMAFADYLAFGVSKKPGT